MNAPDAPVTATGWRARRRQLVKATGRNVMALVAAFFRRQSLIGATPVFDRDVLPWLAEFESHWPEIKAELDAVLGANERLPAFHEVSPDQARISTGTSWQVYPFYTFGDAYPPHCAACPRTAALLAAVPDLRNAMFSILAPHYHIPAHQGPTNGIIRVHLPLIVPRDRARCRIRVGNELLAWELGRAVVFDDYYEHEVWNDTDETRVVLFFDVDRPMRPLGRLLNRAIIALFKQSAYIKDAKRNIEARFAART